MVNEQANFTSGEFFLGCNYWASHAGMFMWQDWNEAVVNEDLKRLAEADVRVLRIFPLWSDFQPLRIHYAGGSAIREFRMGESPLPHTEAGRVGVDEVMVSRFQRFCDLAQTYGIKLIVGLVTGWMSGRMFMPEAFAGRNLISDPLVVRWQIRFIRYMVRRFKSHPAISAWDLGNECNCMGEVDTDVAFCWASQIANTIRAEDNERPVISGMHGLSPEGIWTTQDQGEITDILCTHPYPLFTPYCDTDPINEMKSVLHATAESVMYASLGQKPCFIEEAGTLGPMIANEAISADYVRSSIFSAWAHDLRGFMWWCANEQSHLTPTPYDWNSVERELGLFRIDGSKKPVLKEMTAFTHFLRSLPLKALPPRITDAVCILTHSQKHWGVAYGNFLLAKQAGIDIQYCWCEDEIPDAQVYFLPSLRDDKSMTRAQMSKLMERVAQGAVLYISIDDGLLSPFSQYTGLQVKTRRHTCSNSIINLDGVTLKLYNKIQLTLETAGAEVLAADESGNPALTQFAYGCGTVYFCAYPIEMQAATTPGIISGDTAAPLYHIYSRLHLTNPQKAAQKCNPYLGMTEHIIDNRRRWLLLLNHTPNEINDTVTLKGWKFHQLMEYHGGAAEPCNDGFSLHLPGNTGIVVEIVPET